MRPHNLNIPVGGLKVPPELRFDLNQITISDHTLTLSIFVAALCSASDTGDSSDEVIPYWLSGKYGNFACVPGAGRAHSG